MASLSGLACANDDGDTNASTTNATTEAGSTGLMTTGPGTPGSTTNVETSGMESTGAGTGATAGESTGATSGATTGVGTTGETTGGGVQPALPGTHRFDCLDIVDLGDSNGDGQPDGGAIQALLLQNTWAADIQDFRLNILLSVQSVDAASGMAEMMIASGIGPDADNQCAEPSSVSDMLESGFDAAMAAWQPLQAPGACAEPAAGGPADFGGTYTLALGAQDTIHIYAQEADGTTLNCVPGSGAPNAVPLHAVQATLTMDEAAGIAAGELTGCLLASEAQDLCSCLSDCNGSGHPDCGGCPNGSVPLSALLGGVGSTENCTNLMGDTAYDLRVRFSTQRIAADQPMACEA
jgi:hypothetical protein